MSPAQAALAVVATLAGLWDLRSRRIPNWVTIPGLIAGFALIPPLEAAKGAGLSLLIYLPLYLLRAAGGGDLKLMAAVGALTGPTAWMVIFVLSAILGGIAAITLAIAKGRLRATLQNVGHIFRSGATLQSPLKDRPDLDIDNEQALTLPRGAIIAVSVWLYLAAV